MNEQQDNNISISLATFYTILFLILGLCFGWYASPRSVECNNIDIPNINNIDSPDIQSILFKTANNWSRNYDVIVIDAETSSMFPTIVNRNQILVYTTFNESELNIGNIIIYKSEEFPVDYIIHRIINKEIRNNIMHYELKGDNNAIPDPYWITSNDIIGIIGGIIY